MTKFYMYFTTYLSTKVAVRIEFSKKTTQNYINPFNEKPQPKDEDENIFQLPNSNKPKIKIKTNIFEKPMEYNINPSKMTQKEEHDNDDCGNKCSFFKFTVKL